MLRLVSRFLLSVIAVVAWIHPVSGEEQSQFHKDLAALVESGGITQAMADRVIAEKEARRACKLAICRMFAGEAADQGVHSCDVVKTWLHQEITRKILGNRISWPYGHAQCQTTLRMDGAATAALRVAGEATLEMEKHTVDCTLDDSEGDEAHAVSFSVAPVFTFENGRATKAAMNWSGIDGSTVASSAVWSAIQVDRMFGVLDGVAVEQLNSFLFDKCSGEGVEITEVQ